MGAGKKPSAQAKRMYSATKSVNKPLEFGVIPYDHCFGVGYESGHAGYSPYERVNTYRDIVVHGDYRVDAKRALLTTEAYKKFETEPHAVKMGHVFEYIVNNMGIYINEHQLIVGGISGYLLAAPVYPEFSLQWVLDEMTSHPSFPTFAKRTHDYYNIDQKTIDDLASIGDYWKGRTVEDAINAQLSDDEKKGSELGRGVFLLNLYHYGGIGHFIPHYEKLLKIGFGGYRKRAEAKMAALDMTLPGSADKRNYYIGTLAVLDGVKAYILRHADLAEEMAATETNAKRKGELKQIAANCRQVAEGPARNFWEALQLWNFAAMFILIESTGHSVSYGRMDQWLYPYYRKDMDAGAHSQEFMQELLEMAFVQADTPKKLRDYLTTLANSGRTWGGETLTVGGVDRFGQDATNALTFMILDASAHTRQIAPWFCVRMHANTPHELKVKVAECIRAGYGDPKVFNDETVIPAILSKGRSLEEARDYAIVGCVELDTPGKEHGWHDAAYFNIAKVFELAMNDGQCTDCSSACPRFGVCAGIGGRIGPQTGSLKEFKSLDDVKTSFKNQLQYWTDQMVAGIEIMDVTHRRLRQTPYASILIDDCIERGLDMSEGGAIYNHTGPQACGIGTIADSMSVIQKLVFEDKTYTGEQILQAVKDNWEGHDVLYAMVNSTKIPHYGNDDDSVDEYAKFAFDSFCEYVEGRPSARGGTYTPGVYTVSANVAFGLLTGASIDGRKAGEGISDNMGPVHTACSSHDISGPTAIVNSVTKLNHSRATNGTLLNWKFPPECLSGETGRDNLINLIDTYFQQKGLHSQFTITSTAQMRDALERPEKYRDMLVRVAGYSAYFVDLSRPLQMDIIGRTELSFE